jgi:hypothetical protein
MSETTNLIVITTYHVRADAVDAFRDLLRRHWPVLRELELVTDTPAQYYVGEPESDGGVPVVEIFQWSGPTAPQRAHTHPAISTIWEQMGALWVHDGARSARAHLSVRPLEVGP